MIKVTIEFPPAEKREPIVIDNLVEYVFAGTRFVEGKILNAYSYSAGNGYDLAARCFALQQRLLDHGRRGQDTSKRPGVLGDDGSNTD